MKNHPKRPHTRGPWVKATVIVLGIAALYATHAFDASAFFQKHPQDAHTETHAEWTVVLDKQQKSTRSMWGPGWVFLNFGPEHELHTSHGALKVDKTTYQNTPLGGMVCVHIQTSTQSHSTLQRLADSTADCEGTTPSPAGE